MNRRHFLRRWIDRPTSGGGREVLLPAAGLESYVPDPSHPWDAIRVGHLLRRTTFMPRWSDIATLMTMTPSEAVELLLDTASQPQRPGVADNATESLEGLDVVLSAQVKAQWENDAGVLRGWWAKAMSEAGLTIAEKMAAFWSGHFTTEFLVEDDYVQAPLLYRQNQVFREYGLGNLRDLVKRVTLDGAMLVYLGGDLSNAVAPNENYARELLELYTTGLGWYTEGDVQNAARILTGWRIARYSDMPAPNGIFEVYFHPAAHDIGAKEFMTISFPARDTTTNTEFIVRRDEIHRLIDVIFEQRSRPVAEHICRKIYRYFVYSNPGAADDAIVSAMADLFIQSDFEIRPVMAALLKSAHFFDNAVIGAQIKTPAELMVGLVRQMGSSVDPSAVMSRLGETLYDPPNVSGWNGWHDWITTTTFPLRSTTVQGAAAAMPESAISSLILSMPDGATDVHAVATNLAAMFLPRPLSTERKATIEQKLLANGPDYDWDDIVANPTALARNVHDALAYMVDLPDFQLC